MDDETRRAVETELGRGYGGMERRRRGEKREEVRKRMLRWKASVDMVQRTTGRVS